MILLFCLSKSLLIIFNNSDDPTLQYTDDGKMIFRISIVGNDPSSIRSIQIFKEVRGSLNSEVACSAIEEPPPSYYIITNKAPILGL